MHFLYGILRPYKLRIPIDLITNLKPEPSLHQPNNQILIIPLTNKHLNLLIIIPITKINIPDKQIIRIIYLY